MKTVTCSIVLIRPYVTVPAGVQLFISRPVIVMGTVTNSVTLRRSFRVTDRLNVMGDTGLGEEVDVLLAFVGLLLLLVIVCALFVVMGDMCLVVSRSVHALFLLLHVRLSVMYTVPQESSTDLMNEI